MTDIKEQLDYLYNKMQSLVDRAFNMIDMHNDTNRSILQALDNVDNSELKFMASELKIKYAASLKLTENITGDLQKIKDMISGEYKFKINKTDIDLLYRHIDEYEKLLEEYSTDMMYFRTGSRDIIKKYIDVKFTLDTIEKRNKCIKLLKRASKQKTSDYKELMTGLNRDIQDMIHIRKELGEFPEGSELYNDYSILMDARIKLQEHSDRWDILKNTYLKGLDRATDSKLVTAFTNTRDFVDETEQYFNEMVAELNRIKYNLDKALADIEKDKEDIEIDCDSDLLDI